jgi:hydrogenase nickel incorporation protein HypA/HybF
VRVGDLAGVVADSLEFCFGALVAGTPYRACYLAIERVPARGECAACARIVTLEWPGLTCPACGSLGIARLGGTDLQVVDIELDDGKTGQTGPIRASGSERAARNGAGIVGPRE